MNLSKIPKEFTEDLKKIIKVCKSVLKQNLVSIVLFGSVVAQKYNEHSDLDILVIVDKLQLDKYKMEANINTKCILNHIVHPIDITVKTKKGMELGLINRSAFVMEVIYTGQTIYGENIIDPLKKELFKLLNNKSVERVRFGENYGWYITA
ncbi:MAG: nucleotidyltransferase domain-containing protein [Methanosarcinales archaeon]